MSKTIAEVYEEVINSTELQKEFLEAEQGGTIAAFAAAHDCEATAEEVQAFLRAKLSEEKELPLDELDQVAGGAGGKEGPTCTNCGSTDTKEPREGIAKVIDGVMHIQCFCYSCNKYFWHPLG